MAELIARYKPGENVSGFASAAVVNAGRFVKISANKSARGDYVIAHCGAGEVAFGVAERDSAATTEPAHSQERLVNVVRRGAIARVVAAGTINAGGPVKSDGSGKAIAQGGSGAILGYACNNAVSDGIVEVDLV